MLNDLKELFTDIFSFLWTPAKTQEDKMTKRYDILITLFVIFIITYLVSFAIHYNSNGISTDNQTDPTIQEVLPSFNPPTSNIVNPPVPYIINTNPANNEFIERELVGIKGQKMKGIVIEKVFATRGYYYKVRYWDKEDCSHLDDFESWELYKVKTDPQDVYFLHD